MEPVGVRSCMNGRSSFLLATTSVNPVVATIVKMVCEELAKTARGKDSEQKNGERDWNLDSDYRSTAIQIRMSTTSVGRLVDNGGFASLGVTVPLLWFLNSTQT